MRHSLRPRSWLRHFTVSALLLLPVGARAGDAPVLVAPGSDRPLYLATPLGGAGPEGEEGRWELVEQGGQGARVPAALVPDVQEDGTVAEKSRRLVATIPPGVGEAGRQFRLEPAGGEPASGAAFRFEAVDDGALGLWQGERPVLVYNHGIRSMPGVPADRNRSSYVHPIHGLDGEVLTDDFPKDHYHHRGLFWGWPHVGIAGQEYDNWLVRGIQFRFERWLARQAGAAGAVLGVENGWYVGDRKVMRECVWLTVHPAAGDEQALDVECIWEPTDRPVTLSGAEGKSYGGLTLRFAPRTETVITTPKGSQPDDLYITRLPWADLTAQFAGAPGKSGAAIFIAPEHPDFPPEWLTRHYGVLCVGWPGVTPQTLQPGQPVHCRYRVWIHRGPVDVAALGQAFEAFRQAGAVRWEGNATAGDSGAKGR